MLHVVVGLLKFIQSNFFNAYVKNANSSLAQSKFNSAVPTSVYYYLNEMQFVYPELY